MTKMNYLSFAILPFAYERWRQVAVVPLVDSVSLIELVSNYEVSLDFDCAGKYGGLVPAGVSVAKLAVGRCSLPFRLVRTRFAGRRLSSRSARIETIRSSGHLFPVCRNIVEHLRICRFNLLPRNSAFALP